MHLAGVQRDAARSDSGLSGLTVRGGPQLDQQPSAGVDPDGDPGAIGPGDRLAAQRVAIPDGRQLHRLGLR